MVTFFRVCAFALIVFMGSACELVCGRIILPEMGLIAPGYWSWFWFSFFASAFAMGVGFIKEIFFGDDVARRY